VQFFALVALNDGGHYHLVFGNLEKSTKHVLKSPGLPDGLFSNQKSKFGSILEGLEMEDVGKYYRHLLHFTVSCYFLWTFGIACGNLAYFFRFGILY
jgi:hypothetical protein